MGPIRIAECCVVSSSQSIRRFQSLFHKFNRLGEELGNGPEAHARRQASGGTHNETDELIMSMESMHAVLLRTISATMPPPPVP